MFRLKCKHFNLKDRRPKNAVFVSFSPFNLDIQTIRDVKGTGGPLAAYTAQDFEWQKRKLHEFGEIARFSGIQRPVPRMDHTGCWHSDIANACVNNGGYDFQLLGNWNQSLQSGKFNHRGHYCALGTHLVAVFPDGYGESSVCAMRGRTAKPLHIQHQFAGGSLPRCAAAKPLSAAAEPMTTCKNS